MVPEDGRVTRLQFDVMAAVLAKSKTAAETARREALRAAVEARSAGSVSSRPCPSRVDTVDVGWGAVFKGVEGGGEVEVTILAATPRKLSLACMIVLLQKHPVQCRVAHSGGSCFARGCLTR